jgi:hypothetical protein
MELVELADLELTYTGLATLDYGSDGQLYGTMDGKLSGERLQGQLRLTNLAPRRADNVNMPTLRGVLTTEDGADVWVELTGVATLRQTYNARVCVTSVLFRTGDERYAWLNSVFGVLEGVLDSIGVGGVARGKIHECRASVA